MRRVKGKIIKLSFDYMLAAASVGVTYYLYHHGQIPLLDTVMQHGLFFAAFFAVFSFVFGTHRAVWRYTSMQDLVNILSVSCLTIFSFGVFQHFFAPSFVYAPSFIILQGLALMGGMAGHRLLYRALHDDSFSFKPSFSRKKCTGSRVLLVGAGKAADHFIKFNNYNADTAYDIVGVVDNRRMMFGDMIHGVPVLGKGKHLDRILQDLAKAGKSPDRLVFTENSRNGAADFKDVPEAFLSRPQDFGLALSRLPQATAFSDDLNTSKAAITLKPIAIEDLLGRAQATLDMDAISALIAGKRIAITGAGGSIGSELCRQIAKLQPAAMTMLDFSEYNLYALELDMNDIAPEFPWRCQLCNVRVAEQVRKVFADFKPDIVFHAAALKHVPLVEANPCEGVLTNVMGTRIVAEAARDFNVAIMVQVSTDKAVNPCNVMGASKRVGEFLAQSMDAMAASSTRFVTVRFGNVLGSSGSVVPLFRKQIEKGGPLTVTHPDICRFFMTIHEAVALVLQASSHALQTPEARGQILVLDMGDQIKILDVARQMIRLANLRPDVDIKVNFVGLRPGEKMYEELFDTTEQRVVTAAPQILAAVSKPVDAAVLRRSVAVLEDSACRGDDGAVLRILEAMVPGYTGDFGVGQNAAAVAVPDVKPALKATA
jgi:FlaA1/EpsC-like NDP-sugar epimerase